MVLVLKELPSFLELLSLECNQVRVIEGLLSLLGDLLFAIFDLVEEFRLDHHGCDEYEIDAEESEGDWNRDLLEDKHDQDQVDAGYEKEENVAEEEVSGYLNFSIWTFSKHQSHNNASNEER